MSLTFKLKIVFSVLLLFQTLRHGIFGCLNTEASISIHISKGHSPLKSHVPLLYSEHLPLQRSLHGPG